MTYPVFQAKKPVERDVGFVISGTYASTHPDAGEEWSETFRCVADLPAVMITEGRLALRIVDNRTMVQAGPAARFIATAVVDDERARFNDLVHDPSRLIDAELIGDIFNHLWGVYSENPTKPAEGSANGRASTPATSAGD